MHHHPKRRRPWHHNSKQHVLVEFANLKEACPEGIYLSLTPGNPTQWSGVLFVRDGPYAPAVLRFRISFPLRYPNSPPLITFITDIFHPLVTPLTTYTYTTGSLSSDPVSATDEERLPPGGFGLSHAFPHWFARLEQSVPSSVNSSRNVSASTGREDASNHERSVSREIRPRSPSGHAEPRISIIEILAYVKRAFDDEVLLDELPLETAANPGAWKAWQAHRRETLRYDEDQRTSNDPLNMAQAPNTVRRAQTQARHPDEWSWDGVWKERVKKGIDASISDQVLFGGGDDLVRFTDIQEDGVRMIKDMTCRVAM